MNDEVVNVILWGEVIGAIYWDKKRSYAIFEFEDNFKNKELDVSPLKMPIVETNIPVSFPENRDIRCFHGLPGLVADSLPDDFGNQLINEWFVRSGHSIDEITPLDRLCYVGKRGMGALEYEPDTKIKGLNKSTIIYINELTRFAESIFRKRTDFQDQIFQPDKSMLDILRVGTSAGGAKPKAIIAYNEKTKEIRSGQVKAPKGFSYWLLKFDGGAYTEHTDILSNPLGIGNIEYAYYKMATACDIDMAECRLIQEGEQHHFMTKRFDRTDDGEKIHMQTVTGLAHYDRDARHSYEEIFAIMRKIGLQQKEQIQLYRRMAFNVIARNHDDHTKNFSFLMNKKGEWHLSPAYDMCFSYKPGGRWTELHQLSLNGKRDNFTKRDLLDVADNVGIREARVIIEQITYFVSGWKQFAKDAGVRKEHIQAIDSTLLYSAI